MLSKLTRFFERHLSLTDDVSPDTSASMPFSHKQLAIAALLVEVAHADHHLDQNELDRLPALLQKKFQLSEEQIADLVELGREKSANATSLHQFTQWINKECSAEEKMQLLTAMWEVAYADGVLDKYEEHLIRKVADLIYVSHTIFLQARRRAKAHL